MMEESIHQKMARARRPRPPHRYEDEPELPFVVGVLGDLSGEPAEPLEPFEKRKPVQIDRVNFNEVMARMKPRLKLSVKNTLRGDGNAMDVELKFNSMDDFEPARVVQQVEPLRKLLETRDKLQALSTLAGQSPALKNVLETLLDDFSELLKLSRELGAGASHRPDDETKR